LVICADECGHTKAEMKSHTPTTTIRMAGVATPAAGRRSTFRAMADSFLDAVFGTQARCLARGA
jgi:hypothetical protein